VAVAAVIAAYCIGGIPVGLLLARGRGIDLRQVGSGNIGATNVYRALGAKYSLLGFVLDVLKGVVPVLVAGHLLRVGDWWVGGAGLAAVVGHCFSPYLRLKGGKGVSTSLGVALALHWPAALIALGVWLPLMAVTRTVSFSSLIGLAAAPMAAAILGAPAPVAVPLALAAILCIPLHHENIQRLLSGTEHRFGRRKEDQST
jgi:glycerol-3-phosphate acyltransferase PlsY